MIRRLAVVCMLFVMAAVVAAPWPARAQGGEVLDAGAAHTSSSSSAPAPAPSAAAPSAAAPSAAAPSAAAPSKEETAPRPARGPSVRERNGPRSRAGSTASGALMLVILVGFMGYYVMKKLRR